MRSFRFAFGRCVIGAGVAAPTQVHVYVCGSLLLAAFSIFGLITNQISNISRS